MPNLRLIFPLLAFLAVSARPGVAQQPPSLSDYSVLGLESVTLRPTSRIVSGAVGAVDGTVTLRRDARVAGSIVAGTIELGRETRVGRAFCGIVSVVPGGTDLVVPKRTGIAPVPPGSFDEVIVGRGSLVTLSGGAYSVRSIRIAADGRLICDEACTIGVAETVRLGPNTELGARGGLGPQNVRIDVAGGSEPPAFKGRPRSAVTGTIYAPAGLVRLGRLGSYRGAFVGTDVVVGPGAQVRVGSAL
jgi:hypothetical protein